MTPAMIASMEQYARCAGLCSPGSSGMVASILPWRMAALIPFSMYATRRPSLASLSAAGVMLAMAIWKVKT